MDNILIKTKNFSALVVDDNPVNLIMASKLIEATGADTDTASGGAEAIKMIKAKEYDIVFLDYIMPEMNGIETASAIRALGYDKDRLCLISLSVNNDKKSIKLFKEAGMQDYLPKPIDAEKLNEILKKWLPSGKLYDQSKIIGGNNWKDVIKKLKEINPSRIPEQNGSELDALKAGLDLFIRNVPNIVKVLPEKLNDGKKFAAVARNAKKICLNAGAETYAKEADALEAAALAEDMGFCAENVQCFISNLIQTREALISALNDD